MSAIYGLLHLDSKPADGAWIDAMDTALAGCGPHGHSSWSDGPVALGLRLLHDSPEAVAERQPLVTPERDAVLVADLRLDNRDQLMAELGMRRSDDGPVPDGAILLSAWRRWGEACCTHLEGDFAFAVWDARERRLVCGRDPMGVKPFYYFHQPGRLFTWSSQLAGLLALDAVPRRLDRQAAADHLLMLFDDQERTLFAGVSRLPPAHLLVLDATGKPETRRYWSPGPRVGLGRLTDDGWIESLCEELERAVRVRTRASGLVGAHLSGGLDSSAMVCLAARTLGAKRDRLVALSFCEPPGDEPTVDSRYLEDVGHQTGVEIRYAEWDPQLAVAAHSTCAPGMLPPEYEIEGEHRWARDAGLRVLLSGWGGDEASSFNGRGYLPDLLRRGRLLEFARTVAALRRRGRARRPARFVIGRGVMPLLPFPLWRQITARFLSDPVADRLTISCISPRLIAELGLDPNINRRGLRERPGVHAYQIALLGHGHLVRRMESWSADASRFGLDYRYPLLDRRLLELCLALPERLFMHDGIIRYPFRQALTGRLPDSVRHRPDKADSWTTLQQQGPHREALSQLQREVVARLEHIGNDLGGCLDLDKLRRRVEQAAASGVRGRASAAERVSLTLACSLALFVERHGIECGGG